METINIFLEYIGRNMENFVSIGIYWLSPVWILNTILFVVIALELKGVKWSLERYIQRELRYNFKYRSNVVFMVCTSCITMFIFLAFATVLVIAKIF